MPGMPHRPLGGSGLDVSVLSLGSWRTFERIPRDAGIDVMRAAREAGIDFLDDARYNDETGRAPLHTGYSEVVFGELFRAAGWRRDEVVVANKLWWEFWPAQGASAELDGSLRRMGFDHVDLVYSAPPPAGLPLADLVGAIGAVLASGKARTWGVLNWEPVVVRDAASIAKALNIPAPCAAQLPYSLVHRSIVENDDMVAALRAASASVVASAALAGGALTGKYTDGAVHGRLEAQLGERRAQASLRAGTALRDLAADFGTKPGALALAFALLNPAVSSVLFGATSAAQLAENAGTVDLVDRLTASDVETLRHVGMSGGEGS